MKKFKRWFIAIFAVLAVALIGGQLYLNLDYSPRYLGHEIASGRSESNVWSVANTD